MTIDARPLVLYAEASQAEADRVAARLPQADVAFHAGPVGPDGALGPAAARADVLAVFTRSQVDWAVLEQLPRLRLVVSRYASAAQVDLDACEERRIAVCCVPDFAEQTVAEHTFALLLALSRRLVLPYTLPLVPGLDPAEELRGWELTGKTLGVVGLGRIGLRVAHLAQAFGMHVLAHDLQPDAARAEAAGVRLLAPADFAHWARPVDAQQLATTIEAVPFDDLLRRADVVTLHTPATWRTRHLIDARALGLLQPHAVLLNTARGALVDLEALRAALDAGALGGAGLDVFEGDELLAAGASGEQRQALVARYADLARRPNVVVSPHNAYNSAEALDRVVAGTAETIASFLAGRPINLVARDAC